eukprot:g35901.t1
MRGYSVNNEIQPISGKYIIIYFVHIYSHVLACSVHMGAVPKVYIVAAKRTPFGALGGKLKAMTATELGAAAGKAAMSSARVAPGLVDSVFVGNVLQSASSAPYLSRHVQLLCDIPQHAPALTVNRLCGSGLQAVISGYQDILLGEAKVSFCGGVENMSQAPLAVYGHRARFGVALGAGLTLQDTLWTSLHDELSNCSMGATAEKLAAQFGISRAACDEYALRSQEAWQAAQVAGRFEAELTAVDVPGKGGSSSRFLTDEHPRHTSLAQLAKLSPVFQSDGVVTAGSAAGICDGAGALVLAAEEAVQQHGLTPLARIVSYGLAGVDPTIMGIGPVPAMQEVESTFSTHKHTHTHNTHMHEPAVTGIEPVPRKRHQVHNSSTQLSGAAQQSTQLSQLHNSLYNCQLHNSLHNCHELHNSLHNCHELHNSLHNCHELHNSIHNCHKLHNSLHNCHKLCNSLHNCHKLHNSLHNCHKLHNSLHNCHELHNSLRNCHELHNILHNCHTLHNSLHNCHKLHNPAVVDIAPVPAIQQQRLQT